MQTSASRTIEQPAVAVSAGGADLRQGPRSLARVLLAAAILGLGLYILSNYLRALVWAAVLAVALWPLFDRARQHVSSRLPDELLPMLFTALVGLVFLLPFVLLALEAVREAHELVSYGKQVEQSGIPVPDFVGHLPYGAKQVSDWWNAHLANAGWYKDALHRIDTTSNRELGRNIGAEAVHRTVLFGFSLLTLFFLFKEGDTVIQQALTASGKMFGARGERVGRQIVASIHGTVNGLVLVGIGEGVLLGVVYVLTHVPHPILFGALTAVAAMIPFAAAIPFCVAALLLVAGGSVVSAVVVVAAGFLTTFTADHFVRPKLIGGVRVLAAACDRDELLDARRAEAGDVAQRRDRRGAALGDGKGPRGDPLADAVLDQAGEDGQHDDRGGDGGVEPASRREADGRDRRQAGRRGQPLDHLVPQQDRPSADEADAGDHLRRDA